MQFSLNVPIILGSSRPERQSYKAALFLQKILQAQPGVETRIVDIRDFQLDYDDDKNIPEFHDIVHAADAFVLVFPEYNHSYPGKLKSLLDTEFKEYKNKPVALASVSSGQFGGVRAVDSIIPVLTNFRMVVTGLNLHFPYIETYFDVSGNPEDPKSTERAQKVLQELLYLTKVIKIGMSAISELPNEA